MFALPKVVLKLLVYEVSPDLTKSHLLLHHWQCTQGANHGMGVCRLSHIGVGEISKESSAAHWWVSDRVMKQIVGLCFFNALQEPWLLFSWLLPTPSLAHLIIPDVVKEVNLFDSVLHEWGS